MTRRIVAGDKVRIYYKSGSIDATLIHAPQGVGDAWEFEEKDTGRIFVQNPYSPNLDGWERLEEKGK